MSVAEEVIIERQHQRRQWSTYYDRNLSWWDWQKLMDSRLLLVAPNQGSPEMLTTAQRRRALIELAALAIAAIEANE